MSQEKHVPDALNLKAGILILQQLSEILQTAP